MENITMYERMPTTVIPKQNIFSCKIDPNCISKKMEKKKKGGEKKRSYLLHIFWAG